ncbi:Dabb family protein [Dietzia sp. CH92]|uniref:Dabb family protein n=1 Tax=Dietzia sp. CH92 TaxID=3051823 RepID=UPI0028D6ABB9|nr:Dabb family protein [Dietzia sp. CH92]
MSDVVYAVFLTDAAGGSSAPADRIRATLADLPGTDPVVAPTLPGARNGGDLIVRLRFDSPERREQHRPTIEGALRSADIERVSGAVIDPRAASAGWSGRRTGAGGPGVYRVLLARAADDATAEQIADFERALLRMPAHVPQIRAWRLSRTAETSGATPWTHVWEQEYDELDGLLGPYMNHPIHWAHVDQWFDPESPRRIVRDRVVHTFCAIDAPVLDTAG